MVSYNSVMSSFYFPKIEYIDTKHARKEVVLKLIKNNRITLHFYDKDFWAVAHLLYSTDQLEYELEENWTL